MKNASFLVLLLLTLEASPQGVFTNQTNSAIEKVIRDFPNQFRNIKGSPLDNPINYQSSIQIPGAISCMITRSSTNKDGLCWKAELYETSDFHEAKSRFKDLYAQIKNTIIKIEGEKPYILNGQYEIPDERKRFHSVVFNMLPSVGQMQNLKVELSLSRQGAGWRINLIVHDQSYEQELVSGD